MTFKPLSIKLTAMLKRQLRRLSSRSTARNLAKRKASRGNGLHECKNCGILCYSGSSRKNLDKLAETHKEILTTEITRKGKTKFKGIEMDHITNIASHQDGLDINWNYYILALFTEDESHWQPLCFFCHLFKTLSEKEEDGQNIDWDKIMENL